MLLYSINAESNLIPAFKWLKRVTINFAWSRGTRLLLLLAVILTMQILCRRRCIFRDDDLFIRLFSRWKMDKPRSRFIVPRYLARFDFYSDQRRNVSMLFINYRARSARNFSWKYTFDPVDSSPFQILLSLLISKKWRPRSRQGDFSVYVSHASLPVPWFETTRLSIAATFFARPSSLFHFSGIRDSVDLSAAMDTIGSLRRIDSH